MTGSPPYDVTIVGRYRREHPPASPVHRVRGTVPSVFGHLLARPAVQCGGVSGTTARGVRRRPRTAANTPRTCESMCAGLPRQPNRGEPRSREKSLERVAIGQGRRLIQDISLIREVATEFVHEDAEERHMLGGSPDAHGKSCAAT